ncbi:carboxymuconolactone decarboxylase family protein [Amycolatopsis suaedae]|uniref:Carboxymuconolactone decarboxylase family protein n=1 Tax=Amycolatopsis suaedae TaxID=2510978 RepID=A0A4Q7J2Y2_9PSEU|nr:carboxymuconolactone decarboxylase family protein [Amycolatopsis suaedae]
MLRLALRGALREVRYVRPVPPRRATGLVEAVYRQVERDFGMLAPPVALHSPAPEVLAASWALLRESLVATGVTGRADRERVATAVSLANECSYCAEVHGQALTTLGAGEVTFELDRWVRGAGPPPALPAGGLAELIAVAVTFHYLNRMVTVFLGRSPLPDRVPASARGPARAVLGRVMRLVPARAGAATGLLPAAPPPADLAWAGTGPLAEAFAAAAAAVDAAAARSVPSPVRELVADTLSTWDGVMPGPGRSWAGPLAATVPGPHRAAARLALLTALAPAQVDAAVVDGFGDRDLIELTAWASLAAARVLGARLTPVSREETA